MLAADMLGSPRIAYALARSGQLPRVVGLIHPHFGTPAVAVFASAYAIRDARRRRALPAA